MSYYLFMFSASGDFDKGRRAEDDFMQAGDVCFSGSGHTWGWKSYMTPYCLLESRPRIFCLLLQTLGGRKLTQVEGGAVGFGVNVHLQLFPGGSSDPTYWLCILSTLHKLESLGKVASQLIVCFYQSGLWDTLSIKH